jgi:hypothetical protein
VRRALLRYAVERGVAASNRRDFEVVLLRYDPDVEMIVNPKLIALGFDSVYRGYEAYVRYYQRWYAEWGEFETRPDELLNIGHDRLLGLGHTEGAGLASGVELTNDFAILWTLSRGRVIREQYFLDRVEALQAAGLEA